MIKLRIIVNCFSMISLAVTLQCKVKKTGNNTSSCHTAATSQSSIDYEKIFDSVERIESEIMLNPSEIQLQKKLLEVSFDTISGCFYSVGHGILTGKQEKKIDEELQKRAADATAQRWVLYMKRWYLGRSIRFGEPVSGTITYNRVVYSNIRHDTLYLMIQTPLGSISD